MKKFLALLLLLPFALHSEDADPLHIHFISGSEEYRSESSLKKFGERLEEGYHVELSASWVQDHATDLPNLDRIPETDVLVVFARRMKLPEEQMEIIRAHWEAGKPVVGIRTASHAFSRAENKTFDRKILGGNYDGHFGGTPVKVRSTEAGEGHPVLEGVGPFTSEKLYRAGPLAESAVVLQEGTSEADEATHDVTWVNTRNDARVFYTSLGVPGDFEDENFLTMLENALFWTAKADPSDYRR